MNQKILKVIKKLDKKSQYEEKHKKELCQKKHECLQNSENRQFYNQILKSTNAKRVLEMGTRIFN